MSSKKRNGLVSRVRQQIEFYFGDANLEKDRFLGEKIKEDPYVPISILLTFNKLKSLTTDISIIQDAIRSSSFLELSEDGLSIRRNKEFEDLGPVDERTLYAENISPVADHDWLKSKFSPFGKVVYVSLPRFKTSKVIKGFAFIEFDSPEAVERACQYFDQQAADSLSRFESEAALPGPTTEADVDDSDQRSQQGMKRKREDHQQEQLESSQVEPTSESDSSRKIRDPSLKAALPLRETKASKHNKREIELSPLRVMPKMKWMELRNRYLELQKASFKVLKQKLKIMDVSDTASESSAVHHEVFNHRNDHEGGSDMEDEQMEEGNHRNASKDAPKKPTLTFTAGVIVCVTFKEPITDKKKTINELRLVPNVEFVDISSDTVAFIRCSSLSGTLSVMNTMSRQAGIDGVRLLEGEEETEYWKKILAGSKNRNQNPYPKGSRGKAKLAQKAEERNAKTLNTHIKFDE